MADKEIRVAELTIPNAENYGSVLQAYAMKEFLKEENLKIDIINYQPEYLKHRYSIIKIDNSSIRSIVKSLISSIINFKYRMKKKIKFHAFRKKWLELLKCKNNYEEKLSTYNMVFVGGDQLWNTRITKNNKVFFLDKININKKIAFSVSMGYSDRNSIENNFYKKYVNNFDYIYVRELYDVDYIKSIVDDEKKVGYVLDPTLLVEKSVWDRLLPSRIIKEPYILVYMFNNDLEVIKSAKKFKVNCLYQYI